MSKFYLSLYDYAYELEYGCVLIMPIVYELVLSSCAMFLICSSLFFIVHQISMIRIRIRNGMMVHCAVMVALSLACHSEGVGLQGLGVVSNYANMVFRYVGISGCAGIFRVVGRWQGSDSSVILCIPPRSGIPIGVL